MIRKAFHALESKKPVYQTGISWAWTTQSISYLLDTHSLPNYQGLCKLCLLTNGKSFAFASLFAGIEAMLVSLVRVTKGCLMLIPQNPEEAEWLAEIESVQAGILRWLIKHDGDYMHPEIAIIKQTQVADAMLLGVEYSLWINMDAWNWLKPELENSDVWQCAVAGALEQFKSQVQS